MTATKGRVVSIDGPTRPTQQELATILDALPTDINRDAIDCIGIQLTLEVRVSDRLLAVRACSYKGEEWALDMWERDAKVRP